MSWLENVEGNNNPDHTYKLFYIYIVYKLLTDIPSLPLTTKLTYSYIIHKNKIEMDI